MWIKFCTEYAPSLLIACLSLTKLCALKQMTLCSYFPHALSDLSEIPYKSFFYVSLTVHLGITLANDQLDAQTVIPLLQSSTCACFEQYLAHPQEVKLY
jgi:hypothetical protein